MKIYTPFLLFLVILNSCTQTSNDSVSESTRLPDAAEDPFSRFEVIFDTDANNELDDQHALAYLFFNSDIFDVKAVTVNATFNGGDISGHMEEAQRIMHLSQATKIPLLQGANENFDDIKETLSEPRYDGHNAIDFIIQEARKQRNEKLIVLAVGKLTNVALAVMKAPDIKDKIRLVWLGSNYPEPGEYNLVNDIPSMNYLLDQEIPFEMVMVRYGQPSGSDAVRVTPVMMQEKMANIGPESVPIEGRHGGKFSTFGEYSIDLFSHIDLHGDPPARALFDMVAVAIIKNPSWGARRSIPAPLMTNEAWVERPTNERKIILWENFDVDAILTDFFQTMKTPVIPN